jgi:hypothetical protein
MYESETDESSIVSRMAEISENKIENREMGLTLRSILIENMRKVNGLFNN